MKNKCKKCDSEFTKFDKSYFPNLLDENDNSVSGEYIRFTCPVCGYFFHKEIKCAPL